MKARISIADTAEKILLDISHPIHYKNLTPLLIEKCNLTGKTPQESVRSALARDRRFKRTAEGVFGLSIWSEYPAIRFAKDIAYDILKDEGKQINLRILGERIISVRTFVSNPILVVKNILYSDNRFFVDESLQEVGLKEWIK